MPKTNSKLNFDRNALCDSHNTFRDQLIIAQNDLCKFLKENNPAKTLIKISPSSGIFREKYVTDFDLYFWINLIYNDGKGNVENYMLSLSQQLLDKNTANPHTRFGKIQFWHDLDGEEETGGNPNYLAQYNGVKGGLYLLVYNASRAFPLAFTKGLDRKDVAPWGYKDVDVTDLKSCTDEKGNRHDPLDLFSDAYKPNRIAKIFIDLVVRDLKEKGIDIARSKE